MGGISNGGGAAPLVKRLVSGGAGSRRRAAALIRSGAVTVNGEPAPAISRLVSPTDEVAVNGEPLPQGEARAVYLILNKPPGYISAVRDPRGRGVVLDLVPAALRVPGLAPAGRLDAASSGLIILSNDGAFIDRVTHPRYGVVKEYDVLLDAPLSRGARERLLRGVPIEGGLATARSVSRSARGAPRYAVELAEGKKRELRLMMRAVGREVVSLSRVRIGGLRLGALPSGAVRELSAREARKASHGG